MNGEEFLVASKKMASFIVSYLENIRNRRVLPDIEPGYIRNLLPTHAPDTPDKFDDVMKDIEKIIMPGVTHWHSPRFNAYFPAGNSYPALLGDMLCGAIGCIGFSWISSPASTELEIAMMNWLGELIGLPKVFLEKTKTYGGGVIQGTASESTLVALLSSKQKKLRNLSEDELEEESTLVAYASDQAHSSVEKAAMIGGVIMRLLPPDEKGSLRGSVFRKAVQEDIEKGLTPFFVALTLGTTNSCCFDNLREIGEIGQELGIWCHVDAAYAGSAFICEEYRYLMDGVELMDSFNFNPHKWLLVNFDCSAMWVKSRSDIVDAFNVDPLHMRHKHQDKVQDYRHWQIPLGRRFRSLKLWYVLRLYGKSGLQKHIRKQISLAKEFENYVRNDPRFEIVQEVVFGLVCFRIKGSNEINAKLLHDINAAGIIHLVPAEIRDVYFLRYVVCSRYTESSDISIAWKEIEGRANLLLQSNGHI